MYQWVSCELPDEHCLASSVRYMTENRPKLLIMTENRPEMPIFYGKFLLCNLLYKDMLISHDNYIVSHLKTSNLHLFNTHDIELVSNFQLPIFWWRGSSIATIFWQKHPSYDFITKILPENWNTMKFRIKHFLNRVFPGTRFVQLNNTTRLNCRQRPVGQLTT